MLISQDFSPNQSFIPSRESNRRQPSEEPIFKKATKKPRESPLQSWSCWIICILLLFITLHPERWKLNILQNSGFDDTQVDALKEENARILEELQQFQALQDDPVPLEEDSNLQEEVSLSELQEEVANLRSTNEDLSVELKKFFQNFTWAEETSTTTTSTTQKPDDNSANASPMISHILSDHSIRGWDMKKKASKKPTHRTVLLRRFDGQDGTGVIQAGEIIALSDWKKNSNVAVVSMRQGYMKNQGRYITERIHYNHFTYCQWHDYDYALFEYQYDERREPHWSKIALMDVFLFSLGYEYAMWVDYDSLFMNFSVSVDDMFKAAGGNYDFLGSQADTMLINSGHLLFRNTKWTKKFLDDVWNTEPRPKYRNREQSAIAILLHGGHSGKQRDMTDVEFEKRHWTKNASSLIVGEMKKHVYLFPMHVMNSLPVMYPKEGGWFIHVAGFGEYKYGCLDYSLWKLRKYAYPWYPEDNGSYRPWPKKCFHCHTGIAWNLEDMWCYKHYGYDHTSSKEKRLVGKTKTNAPKAGNILITLPSTDNHQPPPTFHRPPTSTNPSIDRQSPPTPINPSIHRQPPPASTNPSMHRQPPPTIRQQQVSSLVKASGDMSEFHAYLQRLYTGVDVRSLREGLNLRSWDDLSFIYLNFLPTRIQNMILQNSTQLIEQPYGWFRRISRHYRFKENMFPRKYMYPSLHDETKPDAEEDVFRAWKYGRGVPNHTKIEIFHWEDKTRSGLPDFLGYWLYAYVGTNIWYDVGNTIVFSSHRDAQKYFICGSIHRDKRTCPEMRRPWQRTLEKAKEQGYDSIQFTQHVEYGYFAYEIIDCRGGERYQPVCPGNASLSAFSRKTTDGYHPCTTCDPTYPWFTCDGFPAEKENIAGGQYYG